MIMEDGNDFKTFKYFVEEYINNINGGGTFTLTELFDCFKKYEKPEKLKLIRNDLSYFESELLKEDWEIDKKVIKFVFKNGGKNRFKRIIRILQSKL